MSSLPSEFAFRKRSTANEVACNLNLQGQNILITGANSGLGFESARTLALRGAHVIMACRNMVKASEARDIILDDREDAHVSMEFVDFEEISTVEDLAARINEGGIHLSCIILNAGCYNPIHRITDAQFETTFQVNHLAQFYLVNLLETSLRLAAPSRVVVVSSQAHSLPGIANLQPNDISWKLFSPTHKPNLNKPIKAYALSKLANILFAKELHRRWYDKGITACSVHPGIVKTTHLSRNSKVFSAVLKFARPISTTPAQGAATIVYCATVEKLGEWAGGGYFQNCKLKDTSPAAKVASSAVKLFELSEEMIDHFRTCSADDIPEPMGGCHLGRQKPPQRRAKKPAHPDMIFEEDENELESEGNENDNDENEKENEENENDNNDKENENDNDSTESDDAQWDETNFENDVHEEAAKVRRMVTS